jgi:hypothetical protein
MFEDQPGGFCRDVLGVLKRQNDFFDDAVRLDQIANGCSTPLPLASIVFPREGHFLVSVRAPIVHCGLTPSHTAVRQTEPRRYATGRDGCLPECSERISGRWLPIQRITVRTLPSATTRVSASLRHCSYSGRQNVQTFLAGAIFVRSRRTGSPAYDGLGPREAVPPLASSSRPRQLVELPSEPHTPRIACGGIPSCY